jgi:hypothetical protein
VIAYVVPADAHACGHSRLLWPTEVLQNQGLDIRVIPPSDTSGFFVWLEDTDSGPRIKSLDIPTDADVIVLQRPAHYLQPEMIHLMKQAGIAVVVDVDDDMANVHPDNAAYYSYHPKSPTDLSWMTMQEACSIATLVTTSTPSLAQIYAPHGRSVILDNYVPAGYLGYKYEHPRAFGWTGAVSSHPDDPQTMQPAAQTLVSHGYEFQVVGGGRTPKGLTTAQAFGLKDDPPMTGGVPIHLWAHVIAQTMQVGVIPLADSQFNQSKSRLKGIELMSLGIPWVASPRSSYRTLHKESGCGFLASTPKQWYSRVKHLMDDEVLRKEQIEAGYAYMVNQTYEAQAWRWAEAWQLAIDLQRGNMKL